MCWVLQQHSDPLKFSTVKLEEAASIFHGSAYTGERANVKSFRENILSSKIIHFAGHTLLNDSIPELSEYSFSCV